MGNRIADIGKMKSIVDGENRLRTIGLKKTAKLGTEKNPALVHVRTEERFKEITSLFKEKGWKYKIELEPDKPEDITDLERLLNPIKPRRVEQKPGRNEPCLCGSGKKYKNCCGQ
ncbi:MAG TPA: PBPRA1643 family SWIM/SEC-C metal-binding motif protein [Candidatus Binatia bacterium]|jgi:SWIM/SEC-C metal-binding protein|nr:PBPRA1643 family SWIM/SEC-C metal-binding motif protein [Candidatus Binatia bacterium]